MIRLLKIFMSVATALIAFSGCGDGHAKMTELQNDSNNNNNMCEKLPMQADGIVRLSKIRVNPAYLDESRVRKITC